jgi:hypothetical protein
MYMYVSGRWSQSMKRKEHMSACACQNNQKAPTHTCAHLLRVLPPPRAEGMGWLRTKGSSETADPKSMEPGLPSFVSKAQEQNQGEHIDKLAQDHGGTGHIGSEVGKELWQERASMASLRQTGLVGWTGMRLQNIFRPMHWWSSDPEAAKANRRPAAKDHMQHHPHVMAKRNRLFFSAKQLPPPKPLKASSRSFWGHGSALRLFGRSENPIDQPSAV